MKSKSSTNKSFEEHLKDAKKLSLEELARRIKANVIKK